MGKIKRKNIFVFDGEAYLRVKELEDDSCRGCHFRYEACGSVSKKVRCDEGRILKQLKEVS